jgi:ATP-binding cassette subfamily F protein 3
LPAAQVLHHKDPNRSTEFLIDNCELIVAGKNLLEDTRIQLNYGHKYGLVGRNGIGKTQLMSALARGDFDKMPKHL